MRVEAQVRITLAVTPTLTLKFQWYEYQHVGISELYLVIYTCTIWCSKTPLGHLALLVILKVQLVEFRHCSEDLHSCSVFPSILFHSIDNDHHSSGGWKPEVGEYFHRQVMQVNWNEWNKISWTYSIHNSAWIQIDVVKLLVLLRNWHSQFIVGATDIPQTFCTPKNKLSML